MANSEWCRQIGIGACLLVSGCVVLPVPVASSSGPQTSARTNIETATSQRITVGQTTRIDVLLMLGPPDDRRDGDSWFRYRSEGRREGWHFGLLFLWINPLANAYTPEPLRGGGGFTQLGNWEKAKWLVIRFDKTGVVSAVEFGEKECSGDYPAGISTQPCYDEKSH